MDVSAKTYDMRKHHIDRSVTRWVEQAQKDKTFNELPQVIKDAWSKIEKKEFEVSKDERGKITQALHKNALKKW